MAGQAGLRLAENFGEFHDAEGAAPGERQQPQPGRFGTGAQARSSGSMALVVT